MADENKCTKLKTCADFASIIAVLVFLAIPWLFYSSSLKGPREFGTAAASIIQLFYYDAIPFCAALFWLVRRYGMQIDQKMPPFLRTSWIGILLFVAVLGPVFLIKLRWR